MICTTYFLTFFSELIPPTGYYIYILIGIVNPNQQSRLHPKPFLEGPGNNLFYFGQYRPLSHSYNVRTGSDRADTRQRKYSCIPLLYYLRNPFLLRFNKTPTKVRSFYC